MKAKHCPLDVDEINSEDDLQQQLQSVFSDNGWRAWREVTSRSGKARADLIVKQHDFGVFGIETKYFRSGGSQLADAHYQIVSKYRGESFGMHGEVYRWVLCPWFRGYFQEDEDGWWQERSMNQLRFSREFCTRHGIATLNPTHQNLELDFNYSDSSMKVPVEYETSQREPDIDKIDGFIEKKIRKFRYDTADKRQCAYDALGTGCDADPDHDIEFLSYQIPVCEHHASNLEKKLSSVRIR